MNSQAPLRTIGELARLTGLPVRTIRFYSDAGLVPEAGRSPAAYRLYDDPALERLGLVRTLRDLGIDLATIRRVLEREVTLGTVAAAHAAALDIQIRTLRLRRAALRVMAERGEELEVELMNKLSQFSNEEGRRMIEDFVDDAFAGLDVDGGLVERMRCAVPELPEEPSNAQIQAWVELAELVSDPAFRVRVRQMAERASADRVAGTAQVPEPAAAQAGHEALVAKAGAAMAAGIDPSSAQARAIVDEILREQPGAGDGDPDFRERFASIAETFADRRVERYWQLLAVINGWPPIPTAVPAYEWTAAAIRASAGA